MLLKSILFHANFHERRIHFESLVHTYSRKSSNRDIVHWKPIIHSLFSTTRVRWQKNIQFLLLPNQRFEIQQFLEYYSLPMISVLLWWCLRYFFHQLVVFQGWSHPQLSLDGPILKIQNLERISIGKYGENFEFF